MPFLIGSTQLALDTQLALVDTQLALVHTQLALVGTQLKLVDKYTQTQIQMYL